MAQFQHKEAAPDLLVLNGASAIQENQLVIGGL